MKDPVNIIIADTDRPSGESIKKMFEQRGASHVGLVVPEGEPSPSPKIHELLEGIPGKVILLLDPIYLPDILENVQQESGIQSLVHRMVRNDLSLIIISQFHQNNTSTRDQAGYKTMEQLRQHGIHLPWLQKPLVYGDIGDILEGI